jgi:hypothetical protein
MDDDLPAQVEADMKEPQPASSGCGSNESVLVEVTGLEPVTSSLRTKRSTGLSYTPVEGTSVSAPSRRTLVMLSLERGPDGRRARRRSVQAPPRS